MNNLFLLIKAASVAYYAQQLKDTEILNEVVNLVADLPKTKSTLVIDDKRAEQRIRDLIAWIAEQGNGEPIIKSLLTNRIAEILLICPELENSFKELFEDIDQDSVRKIIFQFMKEIRANIESNRVNTQLRHLLKPIIFEGETDLTKKDWVRLSEILEAKLGTFDQDADKAVIEKASPENPKGIVDTINQLKVELSPEGVLKLGMDGFNRLFGRDGGLRRRMTYLINALTGRGKSFTLAHIIASIPLYNKPKLMDPAKIPTVFFCSAEDSMGVILRRIFEIFKTIEDGERPDFFEYTPEEVSAVIVEGFKRNGWSFRFYRVDPNHDNIRELKQRVRALEMQGHEIIFAGYDYPSMMSLDGCQGDSKSDKLQNLINQLRNFFAARGAVTVIPHQLNPKAKELLRENDDLSEIDFVKIVGGNSMTEGSTKITNEVDAEITVHMAKLMNNKIYFTFFLGKPLRGEDSPQMTERFGIYEIEQAQGNKRGRGLIHDIHADKPGYTRRLTNDNALNSALEEFC